MKAVPVRKSPSLMMNIAQTVITAGLEKLENASAGDTRPLRARAASPSSATRFIRTHSTMKRTSATSRTARTSPIAGGIGNKNASRAATYFPDSGLDCLRKHRNYVAGG